MLQPLFIEPSEFRKGDVIFPASRPSAYRIEEIKDERITLTEFQSDGGTKTITVSRNWFSPTQFGVCRQIT